MNTKISVFLFALFATNFAFCQGTIKITNTYGSEDNEIQDLIDFENVFIERLNFQGEKLKGKSYTIGLEEYKNGKHVRTSTLFDGSETDYLKIDTENESIKLFFKLGDGKLRTYIKGQKFGSKKSYFDLSSDADRYTLKDFFGSSKEMNVEADKRTAILAIITPTIHKDGSGSYCEVAQSEVKPEKLGEHFKIPHYFIITIIFQ